MGQHKHDGSAAKSGHVARGLPGATSPRAKSIGRPRTPEVVVAAREEMSRLFHRAVETHHASTRVAAVICVSPQLVRAWGDPSDDHSPQIAQVVAVFLAGQRALVWGFLDDVMAFLASIEPARAWSRSEHLASLQVALGAAAEAMRDDDAAKYRTAIHDLLRGGREALRDEASK